MIEHSSTQLSFALLYHYEDDPSGITIPLTLRYQGNALDVWAKVDPGATVCLFKRELGEALGVSIERGEPIILDTLGGSFEAFGHLLALQMENMVFESIVYFAKHPNLQRNLLGRQGWLRKTLLAINDNDNLLYLNSFDD